MTDARPTQSGPPRRVLVLGGSSGIGLASAEKLAERADQVAVVARGVAGLRVAESRIREHGAEAHLFPGDVTDRAQLRGAIEGAVEAMGGLDLAVLEVGVALWGPFRESTREQFDRVVEVTFTSAVDATRLALPALERSGGRLVYVGSIAGRMPMPMMSSYSAAKHALAGFAETLALELRAEGSPVTVSIVSPGPVDSPFWEHAGTPAGRPRTAMPSLLSYDVDSTASEVVRAAEGRPKDLTVGGATAVARALFRLGGPVSSALLAALARRLMKRSDGSGREPGALESPSGEGLTRGGRHGRPSLKAALGNVPLNLSRLLGHGA